MPVKVVKLPKIADPTIEAVVKKFLKEAATAKGVSKADKKGAIELFMHCMNGYGHQSLSKEENKIFDHYYDLEGNEHREFCQVFGPDKIVENVGEFVGYFLIRKVMMPGDEMGLTASVVAQFCKWLSEKGFVTEAQANEGTERASRAAQVLPRAEDANRLIWEQAQKCPQDTQDYVDLEYMTITRIESDSVWMESDDGKEIGPVSLPKKAAQLLEPNWRINCALAKSRGKWCFAEVGNVYPD